MLQNAYFLAKIGADTAENEQHFAEILPKTGNHPTSNSLATRRAVRRGAIFPKYRDPEGGLQEIRVKSGAPTQPRSLCMRDHDLSLPMTSKTECVSVDCLLADQL